MPTIKHIRKELSLLRPIPPQYNFEYRVGEFLLQIFSNYNNIHDKILDHEKVDVVLFENQASIYNVNYGRFYIQLEMDPRFKQYAPIKYDDWPGSSKGNDMPIANLIELIKYLHAIPKLLAFT